MISRLKFKFITLAASALFCLLTLIVTGMNVINYRSVVTESDMILAVLSKNMGMFPEFKPGTMPDYKLPPGFSPETPYESRYFSILMGPDGQVIESDTSKIATVDSARAVEYAKTALNSGRTAGFADKYRFAVHSEPKGYRVSFLDCGRRLDDFRGFLYTSIGMALAGFGAVFIVIFVLSGKILKPIIENSRKQKRFITDAGHEIKTPLTIINANLDILEPRSNAENESIQDIRLQTARLRSLCDNLVMLSRTEEAENTLKKIDFPLSDTVSEAAHPFFALAAAENKKLVCNIQPMLSLNGNSEAIGKLVYLLIDNSIKYSPAGSSINLNLGSSGKNISLTVSNPTKAELSSEQLKFIFDRFYRADSSRNSETGGHGIGLSVAQAIVRAHGGNITATVNRDRIFQITANFPR